MITQSNIPNFSKKSLFIAGMLLMIALTVFFVTFSPKKAHATGFSGDLHGFAWSMDIGWISLNCEEGNVGTSTWTNMCATSNYKVSANSAGNLSGYAWSPHVGWIVFGGSMTTACGAGGGSASLDTTTGYLSGWARAISAYYIGGMGGWNGCIKLRSTGSEPSYGVQYNPGSTMPPLLGLPGVPLVGQAWGDMALGWIDFRNATFLSSGVITTVDIKIDLGDGVGPVDGPVTVYPAYSTPATADLSWTSSGASGTCTATVTSPTGSALPTDWSGSKPLNSTTPATITIPSNTTTSTKDFLYTITCSGISDSVLVHVPPYADAACTINPATLTLTAPSGSPITLDPSLSGVTWSGTGFHTTTIYTDDGAGGGLTSTPDGSGTVSSSGTPFGVTITGPAITSPAMIYVYGYGTVAGTTVYCDPSIVTINPPSGGSSSGGGGGPRRPAWIEF